MNAWPTLREWMQFGGTLALEVVVVFAVAKLVMLRVRSAQGRRALWQITLLAMLLISVGELNGARGWLRLPEKNTPPATRKVIVTFQDAEPNLELFRESLLAGASPVSSALKPAPRSTVWQRPALWPVLFWALGAGMILFRLAIAQVMAGVIRFRAGRRTVDPLALRARSETGLAARGFPPGWLDDDANLLARAHHIQDALAQRAASVPLADQRVKRQRDAGGTLGRSVRLIESSRALAPFTFGVWRPVIVLPRNFTISFTREQQDAALAHELAHVAGFDSAWRALSQGICAVLWWHPLAWLTKRELDHASELVADEASLLVANGPDRLAECLLACAKELRRPALAGWLGMDGGGFRSALGKRVTRLLQLNPHARLSRPVPWYFRLLAPVVCAALLWLGMAAVMKPGASRGDAWRASILGSAWAAAQAVKPSDRAATATNSSTVSNLNSSRSNEPTPLHTRFFHMDTNAFHRVFNSAPPDRDSGSSRTLFNRGTPATGPNRPTYLMEVTPAEVVTPGMRSWFQSVGVDSTEPGKAVFYNDKLGLLMIRATLEDLDVIEKTLQPFGIKPGAGFLEGRAAADEPANITEEMQIEGGRLVQAGKIYYETDQMHAARTNLQAALLLNPTHQGALYFLDLVNARELAVRAKLKDLKMEPMDAWTNQVLDVSNTNLQTRFFKVDPKTLEQGLKSISAHEPRGEKKPIFNPYDTNSVIERVQRLFQTAGVDLSAPGRALFYQERVGTVMVRATSAEMETVEKAIQLLNMTPPQLTIRVKVLEVERKSGDERGFDWFLGTLITNATPAGVAPRSSAPVGQESDAIPVSLLTSGLRTKSPEPATITGILTDQQFRALVKTLENRGGTDLLSAPEITTMSGRQAQIKVVDIKYIVTELSYSAFTTNTTRVKKPSGSTGVTTGGTDDGLDSVITPIAQPFEIGPVIDVVPYVEADGYTITMTVLPTLREFLGYDDPGDFSITVSNRVSQKTLTQPVPLPKFRLRQIAATARIWDGQTLMLSAGSARTMQRKPGANSVITTNYTGKELIYFITPRLIDAAGNPLHADDEFPERHKTVPAQRNSGGKP